MWCHFCGSMIQSKPSRLRGGTPLQRRRPAHPHTRWVLYCGSRLCRLATALPEKRGICDPYCFTVLYCTVLYLYFYFSPAKFLAVLRPRWASFEIKRHIVDGHSNGTGSYGKKCISQRRIVGIRVASVTRA
jgi:hypothetical protein